MRGKDLFEKMTDIDDDIIVKSANVSKRKVHYVRWGSLVACFAIVISVFSIYNNDKIVVDPNLPMLNIEMDNSGGMGFEGYMAYDISDLVNANPYSEDMKITHLPVIANKLAYNENYIVQKPDYALMETLLKDTAKSLGMDVSNLQITNDIPSDEEKKAITDKFGGEVPVGYFNISRMFMEDENYKLEVGTDYTVKAEFKVPFEVPSQYNFTYYSTYDETLEVAEYLKEEFADFIGMEKPTINISGGDFNIHAEQSYGISFFENSNDNTQKILNYHFNTVRFYCNENGELDLARRYYTDLSEVVGEYPIIDTKEATKLLEKGNYITTVPEKFESTEHIKKVELIYISNSHEEIFVPYYRFYVELQEYKREDTGLNDYGAYYVPAVEGEYIENMPLWDGGFNY